jgi:toxin ParE1/3/4
VPKVQVTPQAQADLDEIWLAIAINNVSAADGVLDELAHRISLLEDFPDLGPPRPELGGDARALTQRNYLIFYRPGAHGVEVVRIVHGARDFSDLF